MIRFSKSTTFSKNRASLEQNIMILHPLLILTRRSRIHIQLFLSKSIYAMHCIKKTTCGLYPFCRPFWRPRQESNLHQQLRRLPPYPLGHWDTLCHFSAGMLKRQRPTAAGCSIPKVFHSKNNNQKTVDG